MKKIFTIIISLYFFSLSILSYSQQIDSLFWVVVDNPIANNHNNETLSGSVLLNNILNTYKVSKYEQALPFAKTEKLRRVYEVVCECNIDKLINEMSKVDPTYFSLFKRFEYQNIALYDPEDWMWRSHSDDWLWHLKKIEADKAWDITLGDSNVKVAIIDTDFDITHPDLATKIYPLYDPYDNIAYSCNASHSHGTAVASYVAGETTETNDTPQGQLASVGFNCMMIAYKAWSGNYLQRALHASTVMNANILTSSAGGWSSCPDNSGLEKLIVKEILNNGTTIIMPAGNGNGTHNFCQQIDPDNHSAFFPLSPYYDERIILVSSTDINDNHQYFSNGTDITHSHYPDVDLCSPGYNTFSAQPTECGDNTWPYYGTSHGTSFASPLVAGVASLMYSVNPCMSPSWCQDILKNTTDPITDAANFPNGVGTGRVNAFEAVKATKSSLSNKLDVFIKDRNKDFGNEVSPYHWQADRDESPDIWVRNQKDGYENRTTEEPEYNSSSPVFVYVKVRNKSCSNSTGNEDVSLYWSKASSWSSWPENWDGSQPTIGNKIGTINLGDLQAGRDSIYEFQWQILNPHLNSNWASCLLARIENSQVDIINVYDDRLDRDVYYNNNIAMRNVTIIDKIPGVIRPKEFTFKIDFDPKPGKIMYIGNPTEYPQTFNFELDGQEAESLIPESELSILFDEIGWGIMEETIVNTEGLTIIEPGLVRITNEKVYLNNVTFPPNTRTPIFIGVNFLVDNSIFKEHDYKYHIRQFMTSSNDILGGEHFVIRKTERKEFHANAGQNVYVEPNETTILSAKIIPEEAIYNWYNENDEKISSNPKTVIQTSRTSTYKLEVISSKDGFKDYDFKSVFVNKYKIINITPNPAVALIEVSYYAQNSESASLIVENNNSTFSKVFELDPQMTKTSINLNNLKTGSYVIKLKVDNKVVDVKQLIKL
jgi:subtilisin family serine protease